jgi:cobalt/nickel transport system permease protein
MRGLAQGSAGSATGCFSASPLARHCRSQVCGAVRSVLLPAGRLGAHAPLVDHRWKGGAAMRLRSASGTLARFVEFASCFVPKRSAPFAGARFARIAARVDPALFGAVLAAALTFPSAAFAMHLTDGVLPGTWCAVWAALTLPFVVIAVQRFQSRRRSDPVSAPLAAMAGAAVFALSCMPIPVPIAGTCSHPCGTGLAAVLLGPWAAVLITVVALAIQALFLAHGGITTFGADVLSMGIAGSFTGYFAFRIARHAGVSLWGAAFLAGLLSDWATYATTAAEIAFGLHGDRSVLSLFVTVVIAFVPTQLPLGILEGFLTGGALTFVHERRPDLLPSLGVAVEKAS